MSERVRFKGGPLDGNIQEVDKPGDEILQPRKDGLPSDPPRVEVYRRLTVGQSTFVYCGERLEAA